MLLDHVSVLVFKVSEVVFWQRRLHLVDTWHFSLDDDSKLVTSVIHFFWMRIVRKSDEVAVELLYDCELLVIVTVSECIGLVDNIIMHADTSQQVWLPIQQESCILLSIDWLVYDVGVVPQAIWSLISVVEVWIDLAIPQVQVGSSDNHSECLLFSIARLFVCPLIAIFVCYCADKLCSCWNSSLHIDCCRRRSHIRRDVEAVIPILHSWKAWASEQLDIAECCVEVEVTSTWSKLSSRSVAQRDFDSVQASVDISGDVEEERIVAAPVSSNLYVIYIDLCTLVSMLEPQICRLDFFE